METTFGTDAHTIKNNTLKPVTWNSKQVVNPHMLILGVSGTGKTYNLKKIARDLTLSNSNKTFRMHVFDVHGDINVGEDITSTVVFSESTQWGLNPLKVNADPHFGGVRKKVQGFVTTVNKVMRSLGTKQEATLRNLLIDLYSRHGFDMNNAATWKVDDNATVLTGSDENRLYLDVPYAEKDMASSLGATWDRELRAWYISKTAYSGAITKWGIKHTGRTHPTIADLLRFARLVLEQTYLGTGSEAVANLEVVNRHAGRLFKKSLEAMKSSGKDPDSKADADLEKAKEKALESYSKYIDSIATGRELETVMKYDSVDVLKSVVDRIDNLDAIGIFKPHTPPFDEAKNVWRYDIKALLMNEKKLFVIFKLEELFLQAIQRGEQDDIIDVILLDEAHIFRDDSDDSIVDTIVKEARKFGLALICASQSPGHFSSDFLSQTGTKVVLGLDETQYKAAESKLMIPPDALKWIKPQKSLLVNCKRKANIENGSAQAWKWTVINYTPQSRQTNSQ